MTKGSYGALPTFPGLEESEVCCAGANVARPEHLLQWPQHGGRHSVSCGRIPKPYSGVWGRAHLCSSENQSEILGFRFRYFNRFEEGQGLK